MSTLLTEKRAQELIAMPKRIVSTSEFAWSYVAPPTPRNPARRSRMRPQNPRVLRARLIQVGGREVFALTGDSNGSFGFTLKWQEHGLLRIDGQPLHNNPTGEDGVPGERFAGPHVHYYRPGRGLAFAYGTDGFSQSDLYGALRFFLELCNVQNPPAVQEVLELR